MSVTEADEATRDAWVAETASQTRARLECFEPGDAPFGEDVTAIEIRSESEPPSQRRSSVSDSIWLDYHFRIQSWFLRGWVSTVIEAPCIGGCRRLIHSQQTVLSRITLRSMKPRFSLLMSDIGCTPPSIPTPCQAIFDEDYRKYLDVSLRTS
jgi:hypothetical protein